MRDCAYFEQLCSSSVDGTLTDGERKALDEHLAECPSCAALKRDLETMHGLLSAETEVPDTLHEQIMQRVEREAKLRVVQPEKPARRMPVFTMVAAAAVVVMVVLGGGIGQMFDLIAVKGGGSAATAEDSAAAPMAAPEGAAKPAESKEAAAGAAKNTAPAQDAPQSDENAPQQYALQAAGGQTAGEEPPADAAAPQTENAPADGVQPRVSAPAKDAQPQVSAPAASDAPAAAATVAATAVTLPESIAGRTVSQCYLAEGTGELPELGGDLLLTEGGASYFSLQNNMSLIEKTLTSIEKAGYTVAPYEDVGLASDAKADSWLLIVVEQNPGGD